MEVLDELKNIFANTLNIPLTDEIENVSRNSVPEWDSFNHLLLISEIEKCLEVQFTIQEVGKPGFRYRTDFETRNSSDC